MNRIFGYLFGILEFWTYYFSRERVYISLDIFRVMSHRKREPDIIFNACCTVGALCTWIRVQNDFGCQVEAQN